ncbi:MAG: 50S ribosomal protein L28 [Bacteroidales bacterium]|nr:50S ribosomal protein L28 [Bacteroidales bacterium]
MSKICQITGISYLNGNNVSHSKRRTKRKFQPNLFKKRFFLPEENRWVSLKVSCAGLRLINKIGLQAALKRAQSEGLISNI